MHTTASIAGLPEPDAVARAHSERLVEVLRDRINYSNRSLPFRDYMESVLYEPGLGYYSAGARKFGRSGDFITAPELSPMFSRCLARQCRQVLEYLGGGEILEFGAGTGRMAVDILAELRSLDCLPRYYFILETSADLRDRQRQLIMQQAPDLIDIVIWLDDLSGRSISGVVLANEVLDAMPVHRFGFSEGRGFELCVDWREGGFAWVQGAMDSVLSGLVAEIGSDLQWSWPDNYLTEVNPGLLPWTGTISDILNQGVFIVIDYGYPRAEYYHQDRTDGTLLCHYRHRVHTDPFYYPGLQDITASVDFTALAGAAQASGLQVYGFTDQAHLLIACGLQDLLAAQAPGTEAFQRLAAEAKLLTMPGEMGERFLALAMGRDVDFPLLGFSLADRRYRL